MIFTPLSMIKRKSPMSLKMRNKMKNYKVKNKSKSKKRESNFNKRNGNSSGIQKILRQKFPRKSILKRIQIFQEKQLRKNRLKIEFNYYYLLIREVHFHILSFLLTLKAPIKEMVLLLGYQAYHKIMLWNHSVNLSHEFLL